MQHMFFLTCMLTLGMVRNPCQTPLCIMEVAAYMGPCLLRENPKKGDLATEGHPIPWEGW